MRRSWLLGAALILTAAGLPALAASHALGAAAPTDRDAQTLLVCNGSTVACPSGVTYYQTIQAAVNAAHRGDWVLIWPGVYHEKSTQWPTAGVWIQTPDIHLRGLDRNGVIIDGSNGSASHPCPASATLQDTNGGACRDGIVVYKASGVTLQNLTVCDYPACTGGHGNEIGGTAATAAARSAWARTRARTCPPPRCTRRRTFTARTWPSTGFSSATPAARATSPRPTPATWPTPPTTSAPASSSATPRWPMTSAPTPRSATRAPTRAAA